MLFLLTTISRAPCRGIDIHRKTDSFVRNMTIRYRCCVARVMYRMRYNIPPHPSYSFNMRTLITVIERNARKNDGKVTIVVFDEAAAGGPNVLSSDCADLCATTTPCFVFQDKLLLT